MWNREEPGGLTGLVLDNKGKPIKGASVETIVGPGSPQPQVKTCRGDGSFEFESVVPGKHFLRASARGFMVGTRDVEVPSGQVVRVLLELEIGTHEIGGRITDESKSPLKAEVTLLRGGIVVQRAATDEKSGAYRFRYLAGGHYELQAFSVCHSPRGWVGDISLPTRVNLSLPVVEGCVTNGVCDVCGETKQVRYCRFCHAFICNDCRHNYPERVKAMIRRRLGRGARHGGEDVESAYRKELQDLPAGPPCDNCP